MAADRYIAVEGPMGAGKTALARKLAESLGSRAVLEEAEANPFWPAFLRDPRKNAFQTQLFFLLSRFRQQLELVQRSLFEHGSVSDYMFEKNRIFALVHLGEDEFALYDQVFALLQDRLPQPDLVIYLAIRTEALVKRLRRERARTDWPSPEYLSEINEAYNYFFFHYRGAPLLVVNVSDVDLIQDEEAYRHFLKEVAGHDQGVKHYVPLSADAGMFRTAGD
ncbi:MAG: deoxynucleoside kinase [Thermodesulfobacteriota bacterium]